MDKKLINVIIKTYGLDDLYINHLINYVNKITDCQYHGIRIFEDDIVIESIDINHVHKLASTLLFDDVDSYFSYNAIKSINIKPI